MRVSQEQMDKTHQRIIEGASRMMRKRGIESTSVNDVMAGTKLTHGGFYRHFDSKESLVSTAIADAFEDISDEIENLYQNLGARKGSDRYYQHYLSDDHIKHPELGCPLPALGADVARSGAAVKKAFAQGFDKVVEKLSQGEKGSAGESRAIVMRKLAMLAGAVMIARAADPETAQAVLAACRDVDK